MIIARTRARAYTLPLRAPWQSHHGQLEQRQGWIITLTDNTGCQGYGEAAPLSDAGTETWKEAQNKIARELTKLQGESVTQALESLKMPRHPALRCGIEMALLDLLCKQQNCTLRHWLNPRAPDKIAVNANIGALGKESSKRLETALQAGYRVIKLKVGIGPVTDELALLEQLSQQLPNPIKLRLDANQAWSLPEAEHFTQGIDNMPIESLEEPLAIPSHSELTELQQQTRATIALDESLVSGNTALLTNKPPIRRLILKPMVLGSVGSAFKLAQSARQQGIETLITSTLESGVGLWAISQLAAACDTGLAHGLATGAWLLNDPTPPLPIHQGEILLNEQLGIGIP
ncbi:MAG: o-succinylbenzoate synthase [Gammaproteobacteria bacterium]|nr:o-succinylbenzoate synthase [Gammaproteobacteria bacterium]